MERGKMQHDLALFKAKQSIKIKDGLGLNHMAIQVEDFETLTAYYKILEPMDIIERCTDHGMTCSIYLTDPDGNGIELYCNCQEDPADGLAVMGSSDRSNKELIFTA
jgi:catechol 2,3-dioxygenase